MEFEKTLPKYDIPAIIEAKDKLRKTQNLMQSDDTLKEGGVRKYSLPRSNVNNFNVTVFFYNYFFSLKWKQPVQLKSIKNANSEVLNL